MEGGSAKAVFPGLKQPVGGIAYGVPSSAEQRKRWLCPQETQTCSEVHGLLGGAQTGFQVHSPLWAPQHTLPPLAALPRRTEGQQLYTKHMHAQDRHGHRTAAAHSRLEVGRCCDLPRSLLFSFGTISGERCAWSRHIPGPRQPAGLFFPRWLGRRAQSKEKMLIFRTLKYVRSKQLD